MSPASKRSRSGARVLGRLRLSRSTEESTSLTRQREIIQQWADAHEMSIVGWAVDDGVSGSVDAFKTPELGEWLNDRAPDFDSIYVWKLDRLGRSAIQLNKLFGWCLDHDKTIVSCTEGIDLSTPVGRLIANVIAFLAEGELEMIRERQVSSRRKLRELGRWPGGRTPYGYVAVKRSGGGYELKIDRESAKVVKRIVRDLIDGKPITRIANELNAEGYRPPAEYYASQTANQAAIQWFPDDERKGKWAATPLRNMLRSKALRGYAHHNGETVRDNDGIPVQLAKPLVTFDQWERVQAALDRVQESRRGIQRTGASPLAGVAVCIECDQPLHHDKSSVKRDKRTYVYRHYRCPSRCTSMVPAEDLEELAEQAFLEELGEVEVRERQWVPGDSREVELQEALANMDDLAESLARTKSSAGRQRLQRQIESVDAQIAEMESAPTKEARYEYRPTGQTYGSVWASLADDTDARRELLRNSGITVAAGIDLPPGVRRTPSAPGAFRFEIRVPEEILQVISKRSRRSRT